MRITLDCELEVEFDVSRYVPARTNCLPENATPAEGGEIEVKGMTLDLDGRRVKVEDEDFAEYLVDHHEWRFREAVADAEEHARQERAEAEMDRRCHGD